MRKTIFAAAAVLLAFVIILNLFPAEWQTAAQSRSSERKQLEVSITTLGVPITQNFDTLATSGTTNPWTDNSTLAGWYSQFELNAANPTTYRGDTGASNAGAIYSFGVEATNPLTERAFGSISSGTPGTIFNALQLTNNTGSTITSLLVSFTGEQWRAGGCTAPCTPLAHKLDFQYQIAPAGTITDANTPSTGWVDVDLLDFTTPNVGTSTAAALDGNLGSNRTALSQTISLSIAPGQDVWLRFVDINDVSNDHALSIDDFSVTANGGGGNPGTISINATGNVVNEGAGSITLTVNRTGGTDGTVSVNYTVPVATPFTADADSPEGENVLATGGTDCGLPGVDFINTTGTLTFVNGDASETFNVTICDDAVFEPTEIFTSGISNPTGGATLGQATANSGIVNNDAAPGVLSFDPAAISLDEDAGTANLTVKRTGGTNGTVTVNYGQLDHEPPNPATWGSCDNPGVDFFLPGGTLTFVEGDDTELVPITICEDAIFESDEIFGAVLSSPTGGATIGQASTIVTITDNDPPPPWSIGGRIMTSGGRGISGARVTVGSGNSIATALTSTFGYYSVPGLNPMFGQAYSVSVKAKGYTFTPSSVIISVGGNVTDLNFTANP